MPRGKVSTRSSPVPRQKRVGALQHEPFAHLRRQLSARPAVGDDGAHARREISRERKLAAHIGGDHGLVGSAARDERFFLNEAREAQHLPRELESIAGLELLDEILLELAEHAPAARRAPIPRARA